MRISIAKAAGLFRLIKALVVPPEFFSATRCSNVRADTSSGGCL